MGLDLKILIPDRKDTDMYTTVLNLKRDNVLFEKLEAAQKKWADPIPEEGIYIAVTILPEKIIKEDHYGNELKLIFAAHIKLVFAKYIDGFKENTAVFKFLEEVPNDYKLILYWH